LGTATVRPSETIKHTLGMHVEPEKISDGRAGLAAQLRDTWRGDNPTLKGNGESNGTRNVDRYMPCLQRQRTQVICNAGREALREMPQKVTRLECLFE